MSDKNKEIGVRLSVKDKEVVERALKSLGKEGQDALKVIERSADQASVSLHALDAAASGLNKGMDRLKTGVALAGAALVTGFAIGIRGAIQRMEEMDRMSAQVDRALLNTGNTAKTSAAELADFADALELRTGRAAEEIMAIGGNLATFKFDHEVYYRSIELANDMTAAWGGELKQNLEGLSRALAEPEEGFAMLTKRGITLTDAQGDMVKRFMAVNDVASAQRVILNALEADVKGVAEAGLTPLQRASLAAEKALEDLFEDLVRGEDGSDDLRHSIEALSTVLSDPNVLAAVRGFGTVLITVLRNALEFAGGVAAGLQRVIDLMNNLEGKSTAGLEDRRYNLGREIVDLDRQMRELAVTVKPRESWDLVGQITDSQTNGRIDEINARIAELRGEENQILSMLDARRTQEIVTLPTLTVTPVDTDNLPPPVATKAEQRAMDKAMREAQQLTDKLRTASEDYAATIVTLDKMLAAGSITQETYNRGTAEAVLKLASAAKLSDDYATAQLALERALQSGILTEQQYTLAVEAMNTRRLESSNQWTDGIALGLSRIAERSKSLGTDISDVLVSGVDRFENAWLGALESGKFEWDQLAKQILLDIARMTTKNMITGPISSFISGVFGGGSFMGGSPGAAPLRLGFQAGVGHTGAMIGSSPVTRTVPVEVFANAPRHHTGTPSLKPGEVPFIGMEGEEIGWPDQLRKKYGGGAGSTFNQTNHINGSNLSPEQLGQVLDAHGKSMLRLVVPKVKQAMGQGEFG